MNCPYMLPTPTRCAGVRHCKDCVTCPALIREEQINNYKSLSLLPVKQHRVQRMLDILYAMQNRLYLDKVIPIQWIDELKTINSRIFKSPDVD